MFLILSKGSHHLASNYRAVGEVFNLGNSKEIAIADLAESVITVTGANVGIRYVPYEKAYQEGFEDMERRVPDITKVNSLTGFSPQIDLEQALRLIRDWFINDKILVDATTFKYTTRSGTEAIGVTLVGPETALSRKLFFDLSNNEEKLTGRLCVLDLESKGTGTPHAG